MRVFGITAEYNPFHLGHKYQLEKAKELGATHIVCIMSGAAVQRGDIAVYSKYERARAALKNGADLVIELPCPFSCSCGEIFARSAVSLMVGLGENTVTDICFGCEEDDIEKLEAAAELSQKLKNSPEVKRLLSEGYSYPAAVARSCGEFGDIFSGANNLLAIEYIKAAKELAPQIKFAPIKRTGSGHDSKSASDMPSATFIRSEISKGLGQKFSPYEFQGSPCFLENAEKALLYKLITAEKDYVKELPDMDENLLNRYFNAVYSDISSVKDLAEKIKSKNITLARIRRIILHLALGVRKSDIKTPPYGRILGLNEKGRDILKLSKNSDIPYGTSLKKLENSSEYAKRISHLEQNAVRLQDICRKEFSGLTNEYSAKITIE